MKKLLITILAVALLMPFTGCQTATTPTAPAAPAAPANPAAKAFMTMSDVYDVARAAYKDVKQRVAAGKLSGVENKKADDAWNLFRQSMITTAKAMKGSGTNVAPAELHKSLNVLLNSLKSL